MEIVVPVKLVPDISRELKIDQQGQNLDPDCLQLKINEFDDQALEQALLLKERGQGLVTVIGFEDEAIHETLLNAFTRGADRLIKVNGNFHHTPNNHTMAQSLAPVIQKLQPGLVLTGVQANNDLDGSLGPILAEYLGLPYVGYVTRLAINGPKATVWKELSGGVAAEIDVDLPAVFGILLAEQPPRYISLNKIRRAVREARIETETLPCLDFNSGRGVEQVRLVDQGKQVEMVTGDAHCIAAQFTQILARLGVI